ncbi:cobalamin biosynthesis protein CbiX [Limnohabitans curvus]|jgi:sirohydrochlorin cobaltochelatase|uniref:Cobalamin biosynthesis protein CbiX n=1 Tax=Limnohabitans curvus TaxID=323423 RepID=A0A315ELZ7_9BURK|nr:CbiX/SirB N-terminal domain-containing protein [Limnohabitans curvus]PUE58261.1 cobalamin biosynthesis protein CbiX [Limnohabitans curvus]
MHAIILFAHGSRDPLWHKPIQTVAERIAQRSPSTVVRCAYLELTEPDLPHVANALVAEGATSLCVVPMFLGVGRHAREDLPELMHALKAKHPNIDITCQPAVGEQDTLLDLLAEIALGRANSQSTSKA